jgi:alpha-glucosidase (family GH31 glycosyl hydrolase)
VTPTFTVPRPPGEGWTSRRSLRRLLAVGLCGSVALLPAAGADAAAVRSGPLTATTKASPWHLEFIQPRARIVLSEARSTGPRPGGTIGFRVAGSWWHATRLMSSRRVGRAILARLATSDPAGRELSLRIAPAGRGIVRLSAAVRQGPLSEVEAVGIGFRAESGERYLGFGERSNAVDQRGNTVESYVGEGPYQPGEAFFVTPVVPPWSIHDRADATYFPMPWLLSTRGYGVLLDNTQTSYFRLGDDDPRAWSVEAQATRLSLRVFAGPRPADVLRRLTARVGRQPKPLAPWFLGPWFQTGQPSKVPPEDEMRWVGLLRGNDAPVSVAETHMRYLPCGSHQGNEDYERRRARFFHSRGFAILTYFQEKVCTDYQRAYRSGIRDDAFLKRPSGEVYIFDAFVGDRTPPRAQIAQIDYSAPGAQRFYDSLLREAVAIGHDGWMEDFGESVPPDSVAANGMDGETFHNYYPVLYHRAGWRFAQRQTKPIARFVRSGWTGAHRYAQIVWGGDPTTSWGFDGLTSAVRNGLTMGLSGVGLWGSDIGGYFTLPGAPQLTPELLIRWIQLGAVSGAMRTKATGQAIPDYRRPQIWDPAIRPHWRRYAKLRTQLYPYIAAAVARYRRSGLPLMRHLALVFPRDRRAAGLEDEFMFGPDLLAAPVLAPGQRRRRLYLPRGRWIDFWRTVHYGERRGGFSLSAASLLRGRRQVTVPAPLEQLPLFARAGAMFALLPPEVDTLAPFGDRDGLVHLRDRSHRMRLLLFPRGQSVRSFNYGERLRSNEQGRGWRLEIDGKRRRLYALQASLRTLRNPFRPCELTLQGRALPRRAWSYRARSRVLRARFVVRRGTLFARGCRSRRTG